MFGEYVRCFFQDLNLYLKEPKMVSGLYLINGDKILLLMPFSIYRLSNFTYCLHHGSFKSISVITKIIFLDCPMLSIMVSS